MPTALPYVARAGAIALGIVLLSACETGGRSGEPAPVEPASGAGGSGGIAVEAPAAPGEPRPEDGYRNGTGKGGKKGGGAGGTGGSGGTVGGGGSGGTGGSGGAGGAGGTGGSGGQATEPPPASTVDLALARVEWGQSVIHADLPLVGGKAALLRLHVLGSEAGLSDVQVRAEGFRNGASLGTLSLTGPASPPTAEAPGDLSKGYRAVVPATWIAAGLSIQVAVDPGNRIAETDETNNTATVQPAVDAGGALPVLGIPIAHAGKTGTVVPFAERLTQLWPVSGLDLTTRTPYVYAPGGSASMEELVGQLYNLRRADRGTRYYLGFIPGLSPTGVVGIGYVGYPVSLVKDNAAGVPGIVAHELGHNFGRPHSPCGVSGDPEYPYANARLGSYGWNHVTGALVAPNSAYDVMSYCSPDWISDHTYRAAQDFLRSHPPVASYAAAVESLLVSGRIGSAGIELDPVQRILAVPTEDGGPWSLRLSTSAGEVVVPFHTDAVDHATERHFAVVVPAPGELFGLAIEAEGEKVLDRVVRPRAAAAAPKLVAGERSVTLSWDASARPWAALAHLAEGRRTTLGLELTGGEVVIPLDELPPGVFEVSLSDGLFAERFELVPEGAE